MLLSACMIVKNEEELLGKTLPVLSCSVDEVILVDTGSTDATIEIARANGAKVYSFPWVNDFSAARNESLKYAQGDWIIWIDADEAIIKEDMVKLKTFLGKAEKDVYSLRIYESNPDTYEKASFYFRIKILKNNKGIHFERPFNEQLVNSKGEVMLGDIVDSIPIYHWGTLRNEQVMQE
ncbi:MAG: glycosyltransferase family 2 protein, partial [bacterium]